MEILGGGEGKKNNYDIRPRDEESDEGFEEARTKEKSKGKYKISHGFLLFEFRILLFPDLLVC